MTNRWNNSPDSLLSIPILAAPAIPPLRNNDRVSTLRTRYHHHGSFRRCTWYICWRLLCMFACASSRHRSSPYLCSTSVNFKNIPHSSSLCSLGNNKMFTRGVYISRVSEDSNKDTTILSKLFLLKTESAFVPMCYIEEHFHILYWTFLGQKARRINHCSFDLHQSHRMLVLLTCFWCLCPVEE